jgi:hypothetical protein
MVPKLGFPFDNCLLGIRAVSPTNLFFMTNFIYLGMKSNIWYASYIDIDMSTFNGVVKKD